ncbi:MAG: sulfite exporter TauE/SafE family protein [Chloroflexi bacterium]|nr:sulfite exporter TauE/SafE family protein [Chloroflexota bacterium]
MNLLVAFLTGLTTGGLGCLAMQSGLIASTLAHQAEQDMMARSGSLSQKFKPHIAQPILLFLLSKLVAYTILGLLLGALGSVLQLTPLMSAVLYLAIGVFMLGNGLRMLNVHPIFRNFVIEPPSFLTRFIRRRSKNGTSLVTPIFMGTLTIFLPCGVTQSVMAAALGTGSALQGAALMFAFILGTSPLFFSVSYFATRIGATAEKYFTRIVAVTMILLALVSVDFGLNLSGSPFSFSRTINAISSSLGIPGDNSEGGFAINVTDNGYAPVVLHLPANKTVTIEWVTENTQTCARAVVIPGLNYQKTLPATGRVKLEIPAQQKGTVLRYSCSMGMYLGQLVFDLN